MSAQQDTRLDAHPKPAHQPSVPSPISHPLDQLSVAESDEARELIIAARGKNAVLQFRSIFLNEPLKKELIPFLEAEHAGIINAQTPRPPRLAKVQYDVVSKDKGHEYIESVVDLSTGKETVKRLVDKVHQSSVTM